MGGWSEKKSKWDEGTISRRGRYHKKGESNTGLGHGGVGARTTGGPIPLSEKIEDLAGANEGG